MPRPSGEPPSEEPREPGGPDESGGRDESGGLRVVVADQGPVCVVTLAGELDHDTADELRAVLARPPAAGFERIVVDLADLRFCDSTGLNILLRARLDGQASGRRLELAGPSPVVARLLAITGADRVLRIHRDLGTALGAPAPDPAGPADPPPGPA
ncbi:STAS domain-containing protein [Kitasatospora sp. NPDC059599]|uniref:STAS domain-containing protein n=1 Tax=Kitasatospora sp. NPDC059599 TaxID=3346880 RepID=UPI0036C29D21